MKKLHLHFFFCSHSIAFLSFPILCYLFLFFLSFPSFLLSSFLSTFYLVNFRFSVISNNRNKNLCGQDGRTIYGPLSVPKSTYVTLAHKRKPKFLYFGCSLVRRCNCKQSTSANGTDGQTDRQSATQYAATS